MTMEGCQAFAPHNNTLADPYYSGSESGRRVDTEIAIPLARAWLRDCGAVRACMGYYNDTPNIDSGSFLHLIYDMRTTGRLMQF